VKVGVNIKTRILFTCGREPQYGRNEVILRSLRKQYQVIEVTDHQPGSLTARSLRLLPRLLKAVARRNYDLIFVGFYGYLLVPWLRRLSRAPLVFDAFVSNYDTLCFDRRLFQPDSLRGKMAFWLDKLACRQANLVLLDTASHRDYFIETFDLPQEKVDFLYVSCNEDMFYPRKEEKQSHPLQVLFYSSYLPLHGVQHIIRAAKLLEAETKIRFQLVGEGLTYLSIRELAGRLQLNNVDFAPFMPYTELPGQIAQADLCLAGPFGETPKARRVIPGKLFQFLAMARPAIAGDTEANRELVTHGQNIWLTPLGQAEALATAIVKMSEAPILRESLAQEGYTCYQERASEQVTQQKLSKIINNNT
jgi:glycosyltransferase involved in cell wall biosynthesis